MVLRRNTQRYKDTVIVSEERSADTTAQAAAEAARAGGALVRAVLRNALLPELELALLERLKGLDFGDGLLLHCREHSVAVLHEVLVLGDFFLVHLEQLLGQLARRLLEHLLRGAQRARCTRAQLQR